MGPLRLIGATGAAVVALGVSACGPVDPGPAPAVRSAPSAPPAQSTSVPPASSGVDDFTSPRTYQPVALPIRVRIPGPGIDSRLGRVGLAADGTIAAPANYQQAAWYDRGPRPGQDGVAVIVGHVDSKSGPAVFSQLGELRSGQLVLVDRADGSTARFRVTRRDQFPKAGFPARRLYSPTLAASLLLITCGGTFDRTSGHYRDNIVITATPDR